MFRLLALLGACMFVTLLIAGEDQGQRREGLRGVVATAPAPQPAAIATPKRVALKAPEATPTDKAIVAAVQPVSAPAPEPVPTPVVAPAPKPEPEPLPVVYVRGNAINVREGPGTSNPIVGRLTRGEAAAVVEPELDGWMRIRIEGDGIEGYVAARLMTDSAP